MAKNSSLEKARAAYSKNKNTKYTWKDGKKSEKKKPKKKKKEVASHYGQVEKKTQTAGKQGKSNRDNSGMYAAGSGRKNSPAKATEKTTTSRHSNAPKYSTGAERKAGVERAKPVAQKVTKITTTPVVSYGQHVAKNATDAAGWASKHAYRATVASHRARKNNAVTKNDRLNYAQKLQRAKHSAETRDIKTKTHVRTEEEKFNGAKPTEFEQGQAEYTKKFRNTSKKLEKAQEKTLRSGAKAMGLTDEKKYEIPDIPVVNHFLPSTKAQQKAAEDQKNATKKTALKNAGLDKETFDADLAELDATAKANGITSDTVLENGQTYAEYRAELIRNAKKQKKAILDDIDKKIDTSNVGKVSASDIYVGANKMADELADYMIPYIGTTGKALKAADKILKASKGAKAGKNIVKIGDDAAKGLTAEGKKVVREAVEQGYKEGKSLDDILKGVTKKVKSADFKQNVKRQLIANALQDATIGTTIDALKLKQQGLSGKEFAKSMAEYAAMNAAFGAPLSFAMGRTGKAGKQLISEDIAHSANSIATLTKAEGVELGMLMKKADRGIIAGAEQARLVELQDKALGGKSAIVNDKGKVKVTNESSAEAVLENLAPADAKEYIRLKAKVASGTLKPNDVGKLVKLQEGVEAAYKKTEQNAHAAIDISGRTIKSKDQTSLENAVKFFSRTNDSANLAKAEKSLEIAKTQTRKLNESLGNATEIMTEKTGIKYKWVDDEEMTRLTGESGNQGFTDPSTGEIIINRDSPQAWQTVLGHETGHIIKMSDDEAFKALGDELQKYAEELGEFGELEASMRRRYPEYQIKEGDSEAIIREKEANFQEEMTAEMLGKYIFGEDDKYLKRLAGEQPTTLQRIVAYIKELIAKTKNKELVERLTKMQDDAFKAIEEAKKVDWEKRGLEEVKGKEKEEYIKKSQLAPVSGKDGMYSYAYEAANKLGKTVKSDADSLLKYFQKKGVTAEEMKWTGLGDFIRDNAPVSKQQLLDFIDANNYELYTVVRASNEYKSTLGKKYSDGTREELRTILRNDKDLLEDISDTLGIGEREILERPREALRAYGMNPNEMVEPPTVPDHANWQEWSLEGGKNYREYEYIDPRLQGVSVGMMNTHWGDTDVVVHSRIQDFTAQSEPRYLDEYDVNVEAVGSVGDYLEDRVDFARDEVPVYTKIEWLDDEFGIPVEIEVYEPQHNEMSAFITSTETGEVYAEISKIPRRDIADAVASELQNLGKNKKILTFKSATGNDRVLHVEEIQSDWHNAGQKSGYTSQKQFDDSYEYASDMKQNAIDSFTEHMEKWQGRKIVGRWSGEVGDYEITVRPHRDMEVENMRTGEIVYDMKLAEGTEVDDFADIIDRLRVEDKTSGVPEAPYKNNYTDYAMKRALREAVEDDYDVISWTTAKQQADRWSDEYMEGYRIEYDQDIPSFMKRYVKQWGGKVERIRLAENGEEVWAVRITDEMRDSIKNEGQRRFSRAGKEAQGVNKPMAELAESLYDDGKGLSRAEVKRMTGWDVDTDGKAKFEFSDKDMKLKLTADDLRSIDEGSLGDIIEHEEMFKYYPKFKDINVQFVPRSFMEGADGEFIPELNMLYVAKGESKTETENIILHELQHAIQENEGFAGGASPEFYEQVWKELTRQIEDYKKKLPPTYAADDDFGAKSAIRMELGAKAADEYSRLLRTRNKLRGQFERVIRTEGIDKEIESGKIPYRNTKGEIEARETEARRYMTQDELDANPRDISKYEIRREQYDKYYRRFSRAKNAKRDTTLDGEIQSILKDQHLKSGSEKALEEDLRAVAKLIGEEKVDEAIAKTEEIVRQHMEIDEYEHVDNSIDQNVKELIKSAPINISELGNGTIAHKLENIGMTREDVPYWVQLRSKKGGMPLDRVYQQLSSERPDLFPPDLTHEDKLKAIIEAATPQAEALRKPQDWIDGERQDLELSIFSKVADGVYADKRAVESAKGIETARAEVKAESKLTEGEVKGSEQQAIDGFEETAKTIEEPKQTKKPETKKPKKPEDTRTEVQKLRESKYVSKEVKSALDNIEEVGLFTEKAEKAAKKYNELDKKIAGKYKHIENAKNKEYPTEAEKTAHIAELEDEIRDLKGKQTKVAGEIEDMAKMKKTDPNKTWEQERAELDHNNRKVNKSDPAAKLKQEDSWLKDKWTSLRRLWEDSLIDVENTAKGAKQDPQLRGEILTAANRVRNSASMTNFWVTKGRKTFDNKVGGKPLDEIFPKSLIKDEKKYADFQEYLVMKHVEARHKKGTDIYADVTPEKAQKIIDGLEERYAVLDKDGNPALDKDGNPVKSEIEAWADDVYAYLKDLQQYRVDSGILSKEAAEQFAEDYPFYVPTNRARDDEPIEFFTGGLSNQIRTAKGGDAPVLDMYAQLYTATNKTIHAAEENNMLNLYFRAKGVTKEQLKNEQLPDLEHAVINATVNKKSGAAKVSFFVDGVPVEYPCSHQLALGLRELDGMEFERLMKAAKVATLYGKPFKALITDWNLVFGVRNGMRDIQQAVVNSKDTRFFGSSFGAAAHSIANKNSPYRKAYASMGGEHAQLVSYDAVAKNMGLEKGKIDKFHETMQDFVDVSVNINGREVHTNVIHYIEGINGAIEMMPRMCEFIGTIRKEADTILKKDGSSLKELRNEVKKEVQALEKEGKIGQSEIPAEVENRLAERILDLVGKDTLDTAMRNANDITLNFGRSGVLGKALNMGFVPYLNPSIQGLSKLARLFTEAGQEGGWKALASIGMKLSVFTLAPAVWNEVALRNNEDYQNLNTRDKDNNFFIALGDGKFIKIPKPRENAVLAEPVEYGLRYFFDKTEYAFFDWDKMKLESDNLWDKIPLTDEGKQAFRTAVDNIGIINPMTSNMVSPLWQTFHNKTWYGGDIESAYEIENKKVKDRYDSGTTGLAIALGKTRGAQALNLSPKKIDNILDSYTGMIYDLWLSQRTEEAKTRGNYIVRTMASQFTKDAVFSNKLSTKAWEKTDGMSEEEQQKYKGTYMYDAFKYDDAIDRITADKTMTNEEKMTAKRELRKKRNELNRAAIDGTANKSNPLPDIAKYLGATEALENFLPEQKDKKGKPVDDDWESYFDRYEKANNYDGMTEKQKEKASKAFLDVYSLGVKGQKIASPDSFHDQPKWDMTGVAIAQSYKNGKITEKQADAIATSCGVWENSRNASNKYVDKDGNVIELGTSNKRVNKTIEKVEDWGIKTNSGLWEGGYSKSMNAKGGTIAMSLATDKDTEFKDRSYYIENYSDPMCLEKMNAARGFAKRYKHTTKEVPQLALQADALGDSNTYLKNDEIIEACKAQDGWSDEERAMGYILLGGNPRKNPFGEIGDYSIDGDTGIEADDEDKGKGGHGRRRRGRRRHRGGGGGGGGGKTPFTPVVNTAGGAAKQTITKVKVSDVTKPSDYTKPSTLNDAYRKRVRKLRAQSRKRN